MQLLLYGDCTMMALRRSRREHLGVLFIIAFTDPVLCEPSDILFSLYDYIHGMAGWWYGFLVVSLHSVAGIRVTAALMTGLETKCRSSLCICMLAGRHEGKERKSFREE